MLSYLIAYFRTHFFRFISNPTRLTSYSATLTDNMFSNNLLQNFFNDVVLSDLSDHLPVFAYFVNETLTRRRQKKILSRAINTINLEKFHENLSNTHWSFPEFMKSVFY